MDFSENQCDEICMSSWRRKAHQRHCSCKAGTRMTIAAKIRLYGQHSTYSGLRPFCVNSGQSSPELLRLRNAKTSVYPCGEMQEFCGMARSTANVQHRPQLGNSNALNSVCCMCEKRRLVIVSWIRLSLRRPSATPNLYMTS